MNNEEKETDFQLATYFPYRVRLYYRDVSQTIKDVYTMGFNLSVSEWRTMSVLNDYMPLSSKEIVARSSMDKVNVSRAISSLQKRKYLERHIDPADRRRKKVMRDLIPLVKEVEQNLLKGLSPEEQETLLALMQKVRTNAQAIHTPSGNRPATEKSKKN